jgi:hypothetical protein
MGKTMTDAATTAELKRLVPTKHEELDLSRIEDYPHLAALLRVWQAQSGARPAPDIDPLDLPRPLFPYVMLLDLEREAKRLIIRLAGDFVCEKHGGPVKGLTPYDFFDEADAAAVVACAIEVADAEAPSLARREYVTIDGGLWSYVRLMLPLAGPDGRTDRIFKALEPSSLGSV